MFHAILDAAGKAVGTAAYQRIDPAHGVVEIGNINSRLGMVLHLRR